MTQRIAVIADIHGNSDALRAVLAEIEREGVNAILNLGDHLSGPLAAADVADLLIASGMTCIRGNCDRELVETAPENLTASDRSAYDQLNEAHRDWLRELPVSAVHGGEILLSHGAPGDDMEWWMEMLTPDGHPALAASDHIEALATGHDYPVLLCGHTHLPRILRLRDGRLIVNPGSVGLPAFSGEQPFPFKVEAAAPDARYAMLEKRDGDWRASLRAVRYDASRMIAMARTANRPDWVSALLTGRAA